MANIEYVEDALEEIMKLSLWKEDILDWKDLTILNSLHNAIQRESALTQKQARLLLKILNKYLTSPNLSFDLAHILVQPKWKSDFRKLDLSKSVKVEKDETGVLWFVLKFPYSLIKLFEQEIVTDNNRHFMKWNGEERVRKLKFYEFNIMAIDNFARTHQFTIDDSFVDALLQTEEIWQQQENIIPHCKIESDQVMLVNAIEDANEYFQTHKTGIIEQDLFLAKTMGFKFKNNRPPANIVEKISQDISSHYWFKTNKDFLQLFQTVNGCAAIILDRNTKNIIEWLEQFIDDAKSLGIDTSIIKVCHREPKDSDVPLNDWIKKNNLGGKVDDGKLFIFKQKPAKWLFTSNIDIKIIGTNNYTPINDSSTIWWAQSHPCVCYITDIKPTKTRNKQIVNL